MSCNNRESRETPGCPGRCCGRRSANTRQAQPRRPPSPWLPQRNRARCAGWPCLACTIWQPAWCSGDTLPKDVPCVSRLSSAGSACRPARLQRLRTRAVSFTVLSFVVNDVQRCALTRAVRSSRACFTTSCCSLKQVLTMARWMQTCSHGMRSICTTYIGLPACHECGDVPDRTDPLERASGCCVSKRTPPGSGWRGGGPVGCLHGRHQCGGA